MKSLKEYRESRGDDLPEKLKWLCYCGRNLEEGAGLTEFHLVVRGNRLGYECAVCGHFDTIAAIRICRYCLKECVSEILPDRPQRRCTECGTVSPGVYL